MKKGFKKEIERELTAVIRKTLESHNARAVGKAKKAIKEASKSVAKKFSKTLKALAAKRKVTAKKKESTVAKAQPKKAVASGKVMSRKAVSIKPIHSSNGKAKHKVVVSGALKKKVVAPAQLAN